MNYCGSLTLTPVRAGDTWDGISGAPKAVDPSIDAPLSLVRMEFTKAGSSTPSLTLSSAETSQIAIIDPEGWVFSVLPRTPIGLTAGYYSWSIELTDSSGRIQTPNGGTIDVQADL